MEWLDRSNKLYRNIFSLDTCCVWWATSRCVYNHDFICEDYLQHLLVPLSYSYRVEIMWSLFCLYYFYLQVRCTTRTHDTRSLTHTHTHTYYRTVRDGRGCCNNMWWTCMWCSCFFKISLLFNLESGIGGRSSLREGSLRERAETGVLSPWSRNSPRGSSSSRGGKILSGVGSHSSQSQHEHCWARPRRLQ